MKGKLVRLLTFITFTVFIAMLVAGFARAQEQSSQVATLQESLHLIHQGAFDLAEPILRHALEVEPHNLIGLNNLAIVLAAQDRVRDAMPLLEQAIAAQDKPLHVKSFGVAIALENEHAVRILIALQPSEDYVDERFRIPAPSSFGEGQEVVFFPGDIVSWPIRQGELRRNYDALVALLGR